MKTIFKALKKYQEMLRLLTGNDSDEVTLFIEMMKPYEKMSLLEFKDQLADNSFSSAKCKTTNLNVSELGKKYYEMKQDQLINQEVMEFIQLNENSSIRLVLEGDLNKGYTILEDLNLNSMTMSQLTFLGYALLNSDLRGKTKKDRKKNLLQLLWKVIETEKMNEIYENNLL